MHGDGQHDQVPCPREAELREAQDGLQVHGGLDDPQIVVQPLHEAVRLLLLADVGLHGPDAPQHLDRHRVGLGHGIVLDDAVLADRLARAPDKHCAQRRHEGRDDGQLGVRPIHGHQRAGELDHGLQQGLSGELRQGGQRRRVVDEPARQLPADVSVVESDFLLGQVPEQLDAEPRDCGVATHRKEDPDHDLAAVAHEHLDAHSRETGDQGRAYVNGLVPRILAAGVHRAIHKMPLGCRHRKARDGQYARDHHPGVEEMQRAEGEDLPPQQPQRLLDRGVCLACGVRGGLLLLLAL
mmetsp:Transcript_98000/g.305196  ORF Transcript_98000/g.305196 Transcript_98000/m.305196 type:complete len:296 (+) Transcript_98000:1127-2014(+)